MCNTTTTVTVYCCFAGTNPYASLEVPISLSPWHWGGFLWSRMQDSYPPQGHWQVLHPPCTWYGPNGCGEAGIWLKCVKYYIGYVLVFWLNYSFFLTRWSAICRQNLLNGKAQTNWRCHWAMGPRPGSLTSTTRTTWLVEMPWRQVWWGETCCVWLNSHSFDALLFF